MTTAIPEQQQFVLEDADWQLYEETLKRVGDRHVFVTYDRGRLELLSPSYEHDRRARLLGLLVNVVAEELSIRIIGGGSTTFRRKDLKQGLEPDQCFYVQNVDRIIGKKKIDLTVDPPPDLAIEVEISRRIVQRLPIYEALGVPEIWRDDGKHVRVFVLEKSGEYKQSDISRSFAKLPMNEVDRLLAQADAVDEMTWMRGVRNWVRTRRGSVKH
jgi:Uma2 family endonuclease